jgi:hypothetical protein
VDKYVTLDVEGEFPEDPPDKIKVEKEMGTFVLYRRGDEIATGQFRISGETLAKRNPPTGRLHSK